MKYVIGFDAGTTAFKAGLFDRNLRPLLIFSKEYTLDKTSEGFIQLNPSVYWDSFCELTKRLIHEAGISADSVIALSICSQGETLICVDESGNTLHDAIIWTDTRAVPQADKLSESFSDEQVFDVTGQRELSGMWPSAKILWIKENLPDVFSKTSKFLLLEDYLIFKLTGEFATDKSISSSTTYLDIHKGEWWTEMLDKIGIDESYLPKLYESGEIVGNLTSPAAMSSGLSINTLVVTGGLDQAAGMLGSGNVYEGIVSETTGTCLAVCANIGRKKVSFSQGLLPIHYGIIPNTYYAIYWSAAAGSMYKWIRDTFYMDSNQKNVFAFMDSEAKKISIGCDGLMLMPYMSGLNYPFNDERAKGEFYGVGLNHRREHFARSVLESVAFLLRQSVEEVSGYGIDVKEIYSLGGGAGELWSQIKADVSGKNIRTLETKEATCCGAAMLAAVGSGLFPSFEDASKSVSTGVVYKPANEYVKSKYDEIYGIFTKLHQKYVDNL